MKLCRHHLGAAARLKVESTPITSFGSNWRTASNLRPRGAAADRAVRSWNYDHALNLPGGQISPLNLVVNRFDQGHT